MRFFYGIFFILVFHSAHTQYLPTDTADLNQRNALKLEYGLRFEKFNKQIRQNYSGKERKDILEILKEIQSDFLEEIEDGNFISDTRMQNKADQILNEIRSKNPEIGDDLKILISRYGTVNGYSMFDGTLVLNLGCFKYLENDDQIASVISHEIAHKAFDHMLNSIVKSVSADNSEINKEKIKSLKKKETGSSTEALQMMRDYLYQEGERRRNQEIEADSLGFKYFEKTDYQNQAFVDAFKLMQRYDTITPVGVKPEEVYKKVFDLPNQPFQEDWLKMEDFSGYDYNKFIEKYNQDSIASHPEMIERIALIEKNFLGLKSGADTVKIIPSQNFLEIRELAIRNEVPNLYFLKQYGFAVYVCLYHLQQQEDKDFYQYWLGQSFQKIYEARKSYRLNKYLDAISPKDQSESYMQFLSFMWNLNLQELRNIADYYTSPNS